MSDTALTLQGALDNLEASRRRLRNAMLPPPPDPADPPVDGSGPLRRVKAMWRRWRRQGGKSTAVQFALQAFESWWLPHPWRQIGEAAAEPVIGTVAPLIRRHPLWAVVVAASAGAGLAAARPWRWDLVAQQLQPMRSRAFSWVFSQATSPAGLAVIASLLAGLNIRQNRADAAEAASAAAADTHADAAAPTATAGQDPTPTFAVPPSAAHAAAL